MNEAQFEELGIIINGTQEDAKKFFEKLTLFINDWGISPETLQKAIDYIRRTV